MNLFNFIIKKFYRTLRLSKTTEIANFPFYKNNLIGYSKPFLGNNSNEGFFTRYYQETEPNCREINDFYHLHSSHLFKNEILKAKKYKSKEIYQTISEDEEFIPISGTTKLRQDILINDDLLEINSQRFYYIKAKKNQKTTIKSDLDFIIGDKIKINEKSKNEHKLVLLIFVDGLYELENLGIGKLTELMPNTSNFFKKGTIFSKHYANAEWTLASFPNIFTGGYTQNHGLFHPKKNYEIGKHYDTLGTLFKKKNYMTFQVGGGWRMNPAYGYIKGFDRTIFKKEMDCKEVISEFIENNKTFERRDQFSWLNFNELHHFLKQTPSIISARNLSYDFLKKNIDDNKKSLFKNYDPVKIEVLKSEMKRLDFYLSSLYNYIEQNYSENEYLINLVTDHGHAFLDNSNYILSKSRNHIPWFLRGRNIPHHKSNELTENVDIFKTLVENCKLDKSNILSDGNVPRDLGGSKERDHVFAQSIYPGQKYKAVIKDKKYELRFETQDTVKDNGKFELEPYRVKFTLLDSNKDEINDNIKEKFIRICLNHVSDWLNKVNYEKKN